MLTENNIFEVEEYEPKSVDEILEEIDEFIAKHGTSKNLELTKLVLEWAYDKGTII